MAKRYLVLFEWEENENHNDPRYPKWVAKNEYEGIFNSIEAVCNYLELFGDEEDNEEMYRNQRFTIWVNED